jgi:hypothetical protein
MIVYNGGSQNVVPPRGVVGLLGGASCLYEEHIYFERSMGAT